MYLKPRQARFSTAVTMSKFREHRPGTMVIKGDEDGGCGCLFDPMSVIICSSTA